MSKSVEIMKKLNQNIVFRYCSSIKLAIPLMLTLAIVVAWGTVVESQYNSEYSSLLIYKSSWFGMLLILLWLNIFCATISRIPFQKRHLGFVITHIGLLTLLMGGYITNQVGIDGQLSVAENQTNNTVVLSNLMLGYQIEGQPSLQKLAFSKMLTVQNQDQLDFINRQFGHIVKVEKYIPFAQVSKLYKSEPDQSQDVALSFILKSPFFKVSEWLSLKTKSEQMMGPATLRIRSADSPAPKSAVHPTPTQTRKPIRAKSPNKASGVERIIITKLGDSTVIKEIPLSELNKQPANLMGFSIKLLKKYRAAIVSSNQLKENEDPAASNPALEVQVEKGGEKLREVLYEQFKQFSLNKNGVFGYHLEYDSGHTGTEAPPEIEEEAKEMPAGHQSGPQSIKPGSRTIEFVVSNKTPHKVEVILSKEGQEIMRKTLNEGEKLVTPWMGIELFVGSIVTNAVESSDVTEINPEKRKDLPPSAVLLNAGDDQKFWLLEGEQKEVSIKEQNFYFYFGREFLELPFAINLKKFSKIDYPGTSTPISYESLVQINAEAPVEKISMNEPLKRDGFTVYQSSYSLNPNEAPVSVFSINKDPGRALKYIGSIILSIGIIILTTMRSRLARPKKP